MDALSFLCHLTKREKNQIEGAYEAEFDQESVFNGGKKTQDALLEVKHRFLETVTSVRS